MQNDVDGLLDRLEELGRLKNVVRTGWVLRGVTNPESVADHSWGTAQLCLLLAPPHIDRYRAAAIAAVHDLAEVETGDIPRRAAPHMQPVSPEEKERRERVAITRLTTAPEGAPPESASAAPLGTPAWSTLYELWDEYTRGATEEARFVRDMNLIDMCLQALSYQRQQRYGPLDEFFATARGRLVTAEGRALFLAILSRYEGIRGEDHAAHHS